MSLYRRMIAALDGEIEDHVQALRGATPDTLTRQQGKIEGIEAAKRIVLDEFERKETDFDRNG